MLSVKGGGVLDGTEVLAIYLNRKTGLSIGDFILFFNIGIFSIAAYFLSLEIALYSILTYLSASKTMDFIIEGVEEYIGVTIISTQSEHISMMITEKLGKTSHHLSRKWWFWKTWRKPKYEAYYVLRDHSFGDWKISK